MIELDFLNSQKTANLEFYEAHTEDRLSWVKKKRYFYNQVSKIICKIILPNSRVLQVLCDFGHLLASIEAKEKIGIDNRPTAIKLAKQKYPEIAFWEQEPEMLCLNGTFDYIFMINAAEIILDLQGFFQNLQKVCVPHTRIICLTYNYLWEPLASITEAVGLKLKHPVGNWLSADDLDNILYITGYQTIKRYKTLLLPIYIPILSFIANKYLARLPLCRSLNFLEITVARPNRDRSKETFSVSIIIPCKNEKGNIESAVKRIPEMGKHTEIIFTDDESTDGTIEEIQRVKKGYPEKDIKFCKGPNKGKAKNVWTGFDIASGDILMILDADLTVPPEELPSFLAPLQQGLAEFVNGSRMIYPMEQQAMRVANILGNKFFSFAFSYLLGQQIKDTLCGTKVLFRKDYERLKFYRKLWGDFDKWGDYELLFGAAKLHLKIIDLPIHYRERIYGETKMTKRLSNGLRMLRMCFKAFRYIKFL